MPIQCCGRVWTLVVLRKWNGFPVVAFDRLISTILMICLAWQTLVPCACPACYAWAPCQSAGGESKLTPLLHARCSHSHVARNARDDRSSEDQEPQPTHRSPHHDHTFCTRLMEFVVVPAACVHVIAHFDWIQWLKLPSLDIASCHANRPTSCLSPVPTMPPGAKARLQV